MEIRKRSDETFEKRKEDGLRRMTRETEKRTRGGREKGKRRMDVGKGKK